MAGVYGSSRSKGSSNRSRGERDDSGSGAGSGKHSSDGGGGDAADAAWAIDFSEVELGELVATGSFGVVHSGRYRGQHVAIKFLLFPEASSEDELNRAKRGFRQEVAVWHTLQHPNVVQFLGAYINPPKWAIVTEFLEGGTVKGFLSRLGRKRLGLKQVASMALDVARGMQYLHSKNIIHRDLKSANLLLSSLGAVKVADFGLARVEAQEPGNMTAETGTIRWMAPEMIDHQPYTRKVDVYSFGIVLWELCTSQWPFEGFSFVQLAHAIVADHLRPPTKECHPQLVKLMSTCWDPNPDVRPDFDEIVTALEAIANANKKPGVGSKAEDTIVPVDGGKGVGGAGGKSEVNGGSNTGSHNSSTFASAHGPRMEQASDSGWKKISAPQPKKESTGCGCSVM